MGKIVIALREGPNGKLAMTDASAFPKDKDSAVLVLEVGISDDRTVLIVAKNRLGELGTLNLYPSSKESVPPSS